jgi:hypothetical protein
MNIAAIQLDRARRPLWKAGLLAALLAGAGNFAVYSICYVTGVIPWSMFSPGRGMSLTPRLVIIVSMGAAVAGTFVYALLKGFSNPARTFGWIALVILLISFAVPLSTNAFTPMLTVALLTMHVIAAVATVWALTVWREAGGPTTSV